MDIPNLLQLDVPVPEVFGRQILAVALMGNVVVLAKDTAEIAHAEEDGTAAIVALDTRLLAKVRCNDVHLGLVADETHSRRLVAVDATETGTKVALTEVCICSRTLLGRAD